MKKNTILRFLGAQVLTVISVGLLFQSCNKSDSINPIQNTVTVKVRNIDGGLNAKHLTIVSTGPGTSVIVDRDINGDFDYTFPVNNNNLKVTATLTSNSPFVCSMEIDRNHSLQAYHNGSCAVNSFEVSSDMNF